MQKEAWIAVKKVIAAYLGKNRTDDYRVLIQEMMDLFEKVNVNMSLKIHLLHHHLEHFSFQAPTESDEQGERFHQTALPFEKR